MFYTFMGKSCKFKIMGRKICWECTGYNYHSDLWQYQAYTTNKFCYPSRQRSYYHKNYITICCSKKNSRKEGTCYLHLKRRESCSGCIRYGFCRWYTLWHISRMFETGDLDRRWRSIGSKSLIRWVRRGIHSWGMNGGWCSGGSGWDRVGMSGRSHRRMYPANKKHTFLLRRRQKAHHTIRKSFHRCI